MNRQKMVGRILVLARFRSEGPALASVVALGGSRTARSLKASARGAFADRERAMPYNLGISAF